MGIKPVYVDQLFYSKNPKLAQKLPKFVFKLISKIIHQNEINEFIAQHGDKQNIDFANGVLEYTQIKYKINHLERLPKPGGRYIFVSNHPLGGPDGIILISFLGKYFKNIVFPVNDLLMNLENLNGIFLAINKHGIMSRASVEELNAAYASEEQQIIIFPAGIVSRKINGKVQDLEWQKSFIIKAIENKRDIIPLHVSGKNSNLFYNINLFRKFIHLNINLEMFLLPHELFTKKGQTFEVSIGESISYKDLAQSKNYKKLAQEIKNKVYQLEKAK